MMNGFNNTTYNIDTKALNSIAKDITSISKNMESMLMKLSGLPMISAEIHELNETLKLLLAHQVKRDNSSDKTEADSLDDYEEPDSLDDYEEEPDTKDVFIRDLIDSKKISVRTGNALLRSGALCLRDLEYVTEKDVKRVRNLGKGSYKELEEVCEEFGVVIGADPGYETKFSVSCMVKIREGLNPDLIRDATQKIWWIDSFKGSKSYGSRFEFPSIRCIDPTGTYDSVWVSLGMIIKVR